MIAVCGCSIDAKISRDGKVWIDACSLHGTTETMQVDLSQREAMCECCTKVVPSSSKLAFFKHRPHLGVDGYYCGCRGWE